jgi:hypothetical protein
MLLRNSRASADLSRETFEKVAILAQAIGGLARAGGGGLMGAGKIGATALKPVAWLGKKLGGLAWDHPGMALGTGLTGYTAAEAVNPMATSRALREGVGRVMG